MLFLAHVKAVVGSITDSFTPILFIICKHFCQIIGKNATPVVKSRKRSVITFHTSAGEFSEFLFVQVPSGIAGTNTHYRDTAQKITAESRVAENYSGDGSSFFFLLCGMNSHAVTMRVLYG